MLFEGAGIDRRARDAKVVEATVTWNSTTVLNVVFLGLAAVLLHRYFTAGGGLRMLRAMNRPRSHDRG